MALGALVLAAAASAQTARIVLRWKDVAGARAYELQIAKDPGFVEIVLQTQTTTAGYRWEELPTATHWYRVRSFDQDGRASEWSPARTIAVDSAVPVQLKPDDGANFPCGGPVTFELEPSKLVKEYVVELSATQDFARPRELKGGSASFTASDLSPGAWWWRTRAVDVKDRAAGPGPARSFAVRLVAPKPKPVSDVLLGTPQVSLSWATVACAARWVVEATHDGKERVSIPSAQPALNFKTGLAGEYRWRVAGVDASGRTGEFSAEQLFRVKVPTPVPRAEVVQGRAAQLSWAAVAGVAGYRVELLADDAETTLASGTVSGTSWRTPELKPGRYAWRVTARDAQGHASAPSEPRGFERVAAVTLAAPAFDTPRDGEALEEGAALEAGWSAVPGATGYELKVDDAPPVPVTGTRYEVPALAKGLHALSVRAVADDGVSPWTEPLHVYWGVPPVAKAELQQVGLEVRVTLLDERGHVVSAAQPRLSVAAGRLDAPTQRDGRWFAQWSPPPEGRDTLVVEEREFRAEWPLARPEAPPFVVGLFAGGLFNGGAVTSPSAVASVGYRLPVLQRRLAIELRAGVYATRAETTVGNLTVSGSGWLLPFSLLVGWHQSVGAYVLRGALGPGLQVGFFEVDGQRSTAAAPGLDVVAGVGRRLGPGRVEAELGFAYARFSTPSLRMNAGGFGVRVGYALDF